jgi:hypothetical protein
MFVAPENHRPVRAKMYVEAMTHRTWGIEVTLRCVTRGEDNKGWASASPVGVFTVTVDPDVTKAGDSFFPGQEWYVDLHPIPEEHKDKEGMALDATG